MTATLFAGERQTTVQTMRAVVFEGPNDLKLADVDRPRPGIGEAVIRITLTSICATDLNIVRGEHPVDRGLILGHEPVGIIEELGAGLTGYRVGDRVIVSAITPCGRCRACQSGHAAQCGRDEGYQSLGGWRLGNTLNGSQAEYMLVPNAAMNLAKIPHELTDEQVLLLSDTASTGIAGAESGGVQLGDKVAVFAQGPIGICAAIGARLLGASLVVAVDGDESRLRMAKKLGVDIVLDYRKGDVVADIRRLTGGVDVAIEALGSQQTFEGALRVLRPAGTLSSLGVYSGKLLMPNDAFAAGIGGFKIVSTLSPGGNERMERLMAMVQSGRLDLRPLITHRFPLSHAMEAYALFMNRLDNVMKIAIKP